jgi:hypothetical protein
VVGRGVLDQYMSALYRIFEGRAQRDPRRGARLWPC